MAKYNMGTYKTVSFSGRSNIDLKLITCRDNNVLLLILQSYILHYYHMHLLHTGMDRTESMIYQLLYWPGIRKFVQKEVDTCDIFQRTKWSNIKYGKLPANNYEEQLKNNFFVYLIGT